MTFGNAFAKAWMGAGHLSEIGFELTATAGTADYLREHGLEVRTVLKYDIPCITNLSGAMACAEGIAALKKDGLSVRALQEMKVD